MNHLDLDAIVPEKITITLNKKIHEVKPLTVAHILKIQRTTKENKDDVEANLDMVKELVADTIPTLGDDVYSLPIAQVEALFEFIGQMAGKKKQKVNQPV